MRAGTCARCGDSFTDSTSNHSRRFCSDNCRKRAREEDLSLRPLCPRCGGVQGESARRDGSVLCSDCYRNGQIAATTERGHQIERWWAEGLTVYQIGDRLGGWSKDHVGVEIARLRGNGFDLPYRRTPEQVQRIKDGWARVRRAAA